MNTDLKHYISFTVFQGVRIIFSTLSMALLARILGPSGLGRWSMVIAAATLIHLLFANWIQQDAFVRFGKPEWTATGKLEKMWSVQLGLLGLGTALAMFVFLSFPWHSIRGMFHLTQTDGFLAFAFFLSLLISLEVQTLLQITGRMHRLAMAPALVSAACTPFYLFLWRMPLPYDRVNVSLMGTILITIVAWAASGQSEIRRSGVTVSKWDRALAMDFLLFAWPILPMTLLGYTANWGNQVLLQHSFSSRDVGLYQSAFQIHSLIVTLAMPFTTIILPRLIDKHLEDPTIMKRYIETIAPTLFCLWLVGIIPVVTSMPYLFRLVYGQAFSDSLRPLMVLLGCTPLCAVGQIYTVLYTVQGKLSKLLWILSLMVSSNFLIAWVVLPPDRISAQTVALAYCLAFIVSQFLTFLYQHYALHEPAGKMTSLFIAAVVFGGGEMMFLRLDLRTAWGVFALACVVATARALRIVDTAVLRRLFSGRLGPFGKIFERILV